MPELPEVETVVRTIRPRIAGCKIKTIEHVRADIIEPAGFDLARALTNRTVTDVTRRAKRIIFILDDENRFYIHLGMSGRLTIENKDAPIEKHTHLIASLTAAQSVPAPGGISRGTQLRFRDPRRFGGIFWLGKSQTQDALGPEPLTIKLADLRARLKKTKRVIKSALLDQNLIAGLGNIYVDESLFEAKIHPLKHADRLKDDEVQRLHRAIKSVLTRAITHKGSTLRDYVDGDGKDGKFQKLHRVYAREGEPCAQCKTPLSRIVVGGRSTHFCKQCQTRAKAARLAAPLVGRGQRASDHPATRRKRGR